MAKTFIVFLCILAPLTDLKVGDVQPAELFMFIVFPIAVVITMLSGFTISSSREVVYLLGKYFFLLVAIIILAMFAMRLPSYPPIEYQTLLKTPPFLSMARSLQLLIAVGAMIILATYFSKRPRLIIFFARAYAYAGLVCALYAIVCWLALYAGISLRGAYGADLPRARGFFIEGGPFGVYIVSVFVVVLFRKTVLGDGYRLTMWLQIGILMVALIAAWSTAGILLSIVLLSFFEITRKSYKSFLAVVFILVPLIFLSGGFNRLASYAFSIVNVSELVEAHRDDTNFIAGRIMATVLVPRMIADQPLTGIGFGNYSVQRNNPEYLQGLPETTAWDLPGLGLAGYIAELGIPLVLVLMWLMWHSVKIARKREVSALVVVVASYQFFAHCFGVQITFVYPWLITALALGYALSQPLRETPDMARTGAQKA